MSAAQAVCAKGALVPLLAVFCASACSSRSCTCSRAMSLCARVCMHTQGGRNRRQRRNLPAKGCDQIRLLAILLLIPLEGSEGGVVLCLERCAERCCFLFQLVCMFLLSVLEVVSGQFCAYVCGVYTRARVLSSI